MRSEIVASCVIIMLCSACIGDGSGSSGYTVRDSADITIVENTTPTWSDAEAWKLGRHPLVDIGGIEGDPNYELFRVVDAEQLADGRIAIANAGTHEVRFYDSEGSYLSAIGGQGDGPGEFQALTWIDQVGGDSLIAYDLRHRRLSVFDSQGSVQRDHTIMSVGETRIRVAGVFGDGSLLSHGSMRRGADPPSGLLRPDELVVRQSFSGELLDSLGVFPGGEAFIHAGGPIVLMIHPTFGRSSLFLAHADHFYVATNDSYEIKRYSTEGALVSIVRRRFSNLEITDVDLQVVSDRRQDSDMPDEMQRMWDEAFAAVPVPETMPAFASALVDDLGNLWVEEYRRPGDEIPRWTVFDDRGVMLGTVTMAAGFELLHVGDDFALGSWEDEMDVEHVQMFELIKGET